MSDLLTAKSQYDDNGAMIVNQVTLIESGKYTESSYYASGSITSMYDIDTTTYYQFYTKQDGVSSSEAWLKWDMGQRMKFKNIILYVEHNVLTTFNFQGSLNNVDWTTLADMKITNPNIVIADCNYRYYKIYCLGGTTNGAYARINSIKGVR